MVAERGFKMTNIAALRQDFPGLGVTMHGRKLAYLDSASSAQKPQSVIDAMNTVYECGYSNIHRGLYEISQKLTEDYEAVRGKVAAFIGAPSEKNIVFTRNATEGINLVAQSWGRNFLKAGDEIILTEMEHHANIVPWQILREQIGIKIRVVPVDDSGVLDINALETLVNPRTRLLALVHISNVLGTVNNIKEIIKIARKINPEVKVLVDGSQSVIHRPVHMRDMDADFFVFTGHKLYGPTGIGVLYGKYELLQSMPPYQGGGDMIDRVSFDKTTYKEAPYKFEAGTPAIVEVIGLGAAIDYLQAAGMENIEAYEREILAYALEKTSEIKGLKIYGTAPEKAGIISFTLQGAHPSDIGMVLDQMGVAIRTGHHCCMPLMQRFGIDATARASLGLYSNKDDIDQWIAGLRKVQELFA